MQPDAPQNRSSGRSLFMYSTSFGRFAGSPTLAVSAAAIRSFTGNFVSRTHSYSDFSFVFVAHAIREEAEVLVSRMCAATAMRNFSSRSVCAVAGDVFHLPRIGREIEQLLDRLGLEEAAELRVDLALVIRLVPRHLPRHRPLVRLAKAERLIRRVRHGCI